VESQTYGSKQIIDLNELEKAFFSNELFFEVKGPNIQFNDENFYPVDYTIQDFSSLPESMQEEAWRRYKIVYLHFKDKDVNSRVINTTHSRLGVYH